MELGKKIRQLRFKAQLTQEQLADRLSVGAQSVSKWENSVAMPDISLLPAIAEVFGVSIDDLFDLTAEQRLNRIENRLDVEDELPQDVFWEYEEFLKNQLADENTSERATDLLAYLYWHAMNAYAHKASRYARESIISNPQEKKNQWILNYSEGHYIWDWNLSNHHKAIDFYRQIVEENPDVRLPYSYLIDNLIADHRCDEAERYLEKAATLEGADPIIVQVYRAHIALARFDEPAADAIMAELEKEHGDEVPFLFEAAQYNARKCNYVRAIEYYERSFEKDERRPRFTDELHAICEIQEIMGDYTAAAKSAQRIIDLLKDEWHMSEEVELKAAEREKARLLALAEKK